MRNLEGKKIAILATTGFEQSELVEPRKALETAGANVQLVSEESGEIRSWNDGGWGDRFKVNKLVSESSADEYDALMLPGGVYNPDKLRRNKAAVQFIRSFHDSKKPIGAICHAPSLLAEADVLKDKRITSFSSIKTDLVNAGANWVDEEVVVDEGLVTSRSPKDIPAFNAKLIEEISEGKHENRQKS